MQPSEFYSNDEGYVKPSAVEPLKPPCKHIRLGTIRSHYSRDGSGEIEFVNVKAER